MTNQSVLYLTGRYLPLLAAIQFFFSGCAELDGVFPKFKPKKPTKNTTSTPRTGNNSVQQENSSEENHHLKAKIEKLNQLIIKIQKEQKIQRDDFLLLQEQWETNFVLLERAVEESLRSVKASESTALIISQMLENQSLEASEDRSDKVSHGSFPPLENYSLLRKRETDVRKVSLEGTSQEMDKFNNIEISDQEMMVEEEPSFNEVGGVIMQDIEDLPDPDIRAIQVEVADSEVPQESVKKSEKSQKDFFDPDLNIPEAPFILIRHPGVKKIYNQGMTAVIQKNHEQAILIFKNFTKRFPDNLDSDNAYYWIGRSHMELNDLKKAEMAFRKVLRNYEHRPTSQGYKTPDVIYMLGKLHEKQNLDQRAVYYFEEVIKRFPGSAAARNAERDLER